MKNISTFEPEEGARQVVNGRTVAEIAPLFGTELPVCGDKLAEWRAFSPEAPIKSIWDRVVA